MRHGQICQRQRATARLTVALYPAQRVFERAGTMIASIDRMKVKWRLGKPFIWNEQFSPIPLLRYDIAKPEPECTEPRRDLWSQLVDS